AAKLELLLAALATQDTAAPFEVIVVLDGSTDDSKAVLSTWEQLGAFASLRWCEQTRQGQAIARNTGSFLARAPILLFLDDDVIPAPDLITVHRAHHATGDPGARARHYNTATLRGMCAAARQEAHGDVLIAMKHPELVSGLRLSATEGLRTRIAAGLAMFAPWLGVTVCFFMRGKTRIAEKLRLRRRWRAGVDFMWAYSYYRGLHDRLGSVQSLRALKGTGVAHPPQQVDVRRPLPP